MKKALSLQLPNHRIKEIIHEGNGHIIMVRAIIQEDGKESSNSLVKGRISGKDDKIKFCKYRGFKLSDLVIIKKNWSKILKAMVK